MVSRQGSVIIEAVEPRIEAGTSPVKRVLGDAVQVSADIFKEGHDQLSAVVRWRQVAPAKQVTEWEEIPMEPLGNDRWAAELNPTAVGRYAFTIEVWPDAYRTWIDELLRKLEVGQDVRSELLEGSGLLRAAADRAARPAPAASQRLMDAAKLLQAGGSAAAEVATDPGLVAAVSQYPDRGIAVRFNRELEVIVDRPRAECGAWYEMFPRSAARDGVRHGTFRDCEALLSEVKAMGFDVLYFPPIHPIGRTGRRGKNNSSTPVPEDVGSPWAIGASEGGHKAVHPRLGTLEDFKRLVRAASEQGIEIALDLAFQCSPDHPYLKEHPEWFQRRPDGTIKTAENPPKRYDDIVSFDFMGPGRESLWQELKSVVLFWIEAGVKIFRVDNPHTKPVQFWEWLIRQVHDQHADVVFLSEAFTRPKVMKALGKAGFSQSYTYFTWRNFRKENKEYIREITTPPVSEYFRGNLWPSTPDILPEILQQGGPAAFRLRFALAATLSSSYGIYSGYELCEARALPGKEEYLDSEKYQLVRWDPTRTPNICDYIARLNRIHHENLALQLYRNLQFHPCDNDRVTFFGKSTPDKKSQILVAVSLDPYQPQRAILQVPLEQLGIGADETYQAYELIGNERALWRGPTAIVELTPDRPAAVWRITRFVKSEQGFDYYG